MCGQSQFEETKSTTGAYMGKPPAGDLLTAICNVNKIPGSTTRAGDPGRCARSHGIMPSRVHHNPTGVGPTGDFGIINSLSL